MANYEFKKDLLIGRHSEEMVLKLIQERTLNVSKVHFNMMNNCDIYVWYNDGKKTTIEVKTDVMAHKTGNIALETWCRGKESGILTTTSDYTVYVFEDAGEKKKYIYRSENLKEYCKKNKHRAIEAGDSWKDVRFPDRRKSADVILIKKKDFMEMGRDMEKEKIFEFAIRK